MIKIIGRQFINAVCPLCDTVYEMDGNEFFSLNPKDEDNTKGYFYCPECNRYVIVDTDDKKNFRIINVLRGNH